MKMGFDELVEIMRSLRKGCPWDRKQTRESLKPFLVEECYEVLEAIEEGNPQKIKEELGDLLFQILFHAEIASERGEFDMGGVIDGISEKMISRHPHVFEKGKALESAEEVVEQWEEKKKEEGKLRKSLLEGIPPAMPALLRAHRLQARAARAGFDWDKVDDVMDKLDEEIKEFRAALSKKEQAAIEDELGDIFFVLVNVSRFVGVNPEDALRRTISKFIHRFRHIEMRAEDEGRNLSEMTLEEMDAFWDEAKKKE
jgi:tetrapyrrole methylase family protein/MazG family protein